MKSCRRCRRWRLKTSARDEAVVYTNKARCRDCYRCVRVCPVKAIRMQEGQAFEEPGACVSCGTCIRECPQGAKTYRNDVERVKVLLAEPGVSAASVAPSFAGVYPEWERKRIASALRRLGFAHVSETAIGAQDVAVATADWIRANPGEAHVATACPAVVRYVERYRQDLVPRLIPVVSPMVAHARRLKAKFGEGARVIFIGPCVAKKMEAGRAGVREAVDAVLTFKELDEWLAQASIKLGECEESSFDEGAPRDARLFPLGGGSLKTGALPTDYLTGGIVAVSGFEELNEALKAAGTGQSLVIEPLFCRQGCINGPAAVSNCNLFERREEVLKYAAKERAKAVSKSTPAPDLTIKFAAEVVAPEKVPSEAEILKELGRSGKARQEDQLNCGACGYASCRDKAVAVLRGMAETEMCLPFMRRRAEQRTDRIIETSPNGIVILDERLNVISMNPAFRRHFMCSEAVLGRKISYLMDPEHFEKLAAGETDIIDLTVQHTNYHLVCHQILYALREEKQYVGIFVNITNSRASQEKLSELRAATLIQAQQLLDHQLAMAQKIGQFLGESAAQGEVLVGHLRQMALEGDNGEDKKADRQWLRNTYTSKR